MKIKDLEDSRLVKLAVVVNDMILLMISYWLAFAWSYSFSAALSFPYALKIILLIGAAAVIPTSYIAPPVFLKRIVHGDAILGRSAYTAVIQFLFILVAVSLLRGITDVRGYLVWGTCLFFVLLYAERLAFHYLLRNMAGDIASLKTWLRRTYLQTSCLYQASLIKARAMAIESENYEMVKRFDEMIKVAQEDMEKLLR